MPLGNSDFYDLLDRLLPIGRHLLLREKWDECRQSLKSKESEVGDDIKYRLELDEAKIACLEQLLGIAIQQYERVSADYANFQKRVPKQVGDSVAYEKEKIIRSLLPILDNMDHLLKAHSAERTGPVVQGVEIIYGHMLDILKSHGVEQIHALGEPFDPMRHEAIMLKEEPTEEADVVLEEVQKGYRINDRVLRPTRVVVSKAPAPRPSQPQNQEPNEGTPGKGDT